MRPTSTAKHWIKVPFVRHKSGYCGPAAISAVLGYYGIERSQEEIAGRIYRRVIKGALKADMVNYVRDEGIEVISEATDIEGIKRYIDKDMPVIVLTTLGPKFFFRGHYIAIVGYDDAEQAFICHTGFHSNEKLWYSRFLKRWRSNWVMVVKNN